MAQTATRQEKDSIGTKEIPANVYYGVQTARAVENYPISGMRAHPLLIKAFGMVKKAAAQANQELGLIDDQRAKAIIAAADEVISGKWNQEFVVDVFQAGAGPRGRSNLSPMPPDTRPRLQAANLDVHLR